MTAAQNDANDDDEPAQPFNQLMLALAAIFDAEGRAGGDQAAAAVRNALSRRRDEQVPGTLPEAAQDSGLSAALEADDAMPIAELIGKAGPSIPWMPPGLDGDLSQSPLKSKLMTARLIGPEKAAIHDDQVIAGFFYHQPGLYYPLRKHAAEETFYIISGRAGWGVEDGEMQVRGPGSYIFHPSYIPHRSLTYDQPVLCAFRWTGNVDLNTYTFQS